MFYWFYRTTHTDGYRNRPIVLWLQGGPGLSGTGFGNFLMFGPLDQHLNPRNYTWINTANILFVDYPGDSGFSVFDNSSHTPVTMEEITEDLVTLIKTFMDEHSEINDNPFYIFGQSYGGKTAAALPYYLLKAIESGHVKCNLKGTAIGNGYVFPADFLVTRAVMAYELSLLDDVEYEETQEIAWLGYEEAEKGNWTGFEDYYYKTCVVCIPASIYNIRTNDDSLIYNIEMDDFMNGPSRQKLGIIPDEKKWIRWGGDLQEDESEPVWHLVDEVLKSSDIGNPFSQNREQ